MYRFELFTSFDEIVNFLNEKHIKKENIIKIINRAVDFEYEYKYSLIYYEERV